MPPSQAALVEPGHGMRGQFELSAVLRGRPGAPPVPAVRYLCEDEALVGAPFYLMEAVNGEPFSECEVAP
jgi:aminoglycoside phosphotransferase (APT) family kinase protein